MWGWRKDQGQRLSVLADCSIANTARRKLISLFYCPTLYHIDTRQNANFHQRYTNLTKYQQGMYCSAVKVFNVLRSYITIESDNRNKSDLVLQKFLNENSVYSLDEYFEHQKS
jgi:hypothetical protein